GRLPARQRARTPRAYLRRARGGGPAPRVEAPLALPPRAGRARPARGRAAALVPGRGLAPPRKTAIPPSRAPALAGAGTRLGRSTPREGRPVAALERAARAARALRSAKKSLAAWN